MCGGKRRALQLSAATAAVSLFAAVTLLQQQNATDIHIISGTDRDQASLHRGRVLVTQRNRVSRLLNEAKRDLSVLSCQMNQLRLQKNKSLEMVNGRITN